MKRVIALVAALLLLAIPFVGSANEEGRTLYVVVDEDSVLNVREKPDAYSARVARLFNGDAVQTFEVSGNWIKTSDAGEHAFGWVCIDYLTDDPTFEPCEMRVKANGRVRIRKTPGGDVVVRYVYSGETLTVQRWLNGWAKVNGGWIDGEFLTALGAEAASEQD